MGLLRPSLFRRPTVFHFSKETNNFARNMDITGVRYARNRDEWRAWLETNHRSAREIWLPI